MSQSSSEQLQHVNRQHLKQHFSHAAPSYDEAAILQKTVAERMDERLELTTVKALRIADIGAGTGLLTAKLLQRYPQATLFAVDLSEAMLQRAKPRLQIERISALKPLNKLLSGFNQKLGVTLINADAFALPFADNSLDMITSNLMLQWCDDLDAVFKEFRRVLRPEGLLMFTTFGPDTLKELRQAWRMADQQSEHVNHFIDMHDIGDALIRAGFGQPVMDVEMFTLTYEKPISVLKDLKAIGATNASLHRNPGLMGKNKFQTMLNAYESLRQNGKIHASYEVVHGHAWAAQEIFKGPDRDRKGVVEISLDEFAKQTKQSAFGASFRDKK
ncbi:malonyl-[acyl-carrier protein] O-methyltransferase 1 [Thiosulfatimonas sediminis]|uniref:Malonyl-[acyl-carrier protein] O-methyltransferase n=1 Tax=Thiosulfatimonas sediminis TaxID=2675054 RepID=A0A6F8PRY7_9GAMM|nr:malonyl-ACP O-methyltransferase BioC [Thiosulfatimonas sediminis]BBP44797.1 malonyl-[acyl-carrier protein] O-methyltransferase 1 [Thiosulfatimonas sediminis]